MNNVYESHYYNFVHCTKTNSLVFHWKPETATMTDNDFKEALSNFAGYAFEMKTPNMVVDVRQFAPETGVPSGEVMGPWRMEVVVPRYNAAGVRKFAYIRNSEGGGPPVSEPVRHDGEMFETAVFDSEEKMAAWLTS